MRMDEVLRPCSNTSCKTTSIPSLTKMISFPRPQPKLSERFKLPICDYEVKGYPVKNTFQNPKLKSGSLTGMDRRQTEAIIHFKKLLFCHPTPTYHLQPSPFVPVGGTLPTDGADPTTGVNQSRQKDPAHPDSYLQRVPAGCQAGGDLPCKNPSQHFSNQLCF